MKSIRRVKALREIIIPYTIVFPVTIEGSVNKDYFCFRKGKKSVLTFPQYENLMHSSYSEYLDPDSKEVMSDDP